MKKNFKMSSKRYKINGKISEGNFGIVYKAFDNENSIFVLKIIRYYGGFKKNNI